MTSPPDLADPAVRATREVERLHARQRTSRVLTAIALGIAATAVPGGAAWATGEPESAVAGILVSVLLLGWGAAIWPWTWSDAEAEHHRLEAIWRQVRTDHAEQVPWPRFGAWAQDDGGDVRLVELRCLPSTDPSPRRLHARSGRRLDSECIADAAQAMEELRADCARREDAARERHLRGRRTAQQRAEDERLEAVDRAAAEHQAAQEARMRAELAAEQDAERRAQAQALARSLRRP